MFEREREYFFFRVVAPSVYCAGYYAIRHTKYTGADAVARKIEYFRFCPGVLRPK